VDQLSNSESKVSNDNPQSKLVKDIMSRQVEQEAIARGGTKVNEVRLGIDTTVEPPNHMMIMIMLTC